VIGTLREGAIEAENDLADEYVSGDICADFGAWN
jgi:hypothetical protein